MPHAAGPSGRGSAPPALPLPPPPPQPSAPSTTRVLALDVEFDHYRAAAAGTASAPPPAPPPAIARQGRAARKAAARRNPPQRSGPPLVCVPAALALVDAAGVAVLWAAIDPPDGMLGGGWERVSGRRGQRPAPPQGTRLGAGQAGAAVVAALAGPPPATTLVGHGLRGDLAALGLDADALPCALADTHHLARMRLVRAASAAGLPPIQAGGRGTHCPAEDAVAAMGVWLRVRGEDPGALEAAETAALLAEVERRRRRE